MTSQAIPSEPSPQSKLTLRRIKIQGFKSLKDVDLQNLNRISVFVGANGAGKSNLLSALRWIPLMQSSDITYWSEMQGGLNAILHGGTKQTQSILMRLEFEGEYSILACEKRNAGIFAYEARLIHARGNLLFEEEKVEFKKQGQESWKTIHLGSGHRWTALHRSETRDETDEMSVRAIRYSIRNMGYFHFHDTSDESPLRRGSRIDDTGLLNTFGANLPSFLRMLQDSQKEDYQIALRRIIGLTKRIAPYIKNIYPTISLLSPIEDQELKILDLINRPDLAKATVNLRWTDTQDRSFNAYDLSDGTLRSLALFTVLGQPWDLRPRFITIDEPELGLHPAALHLFCALCRSVSSDSQIFLATQSLFLLDSFDLSQIIVAEQHQGETRFKTLSQDDLQIWLDDYSLSEIFEKHIIGGYP